MNKEMFVSSTPRETRLAVNEEGEVAEVYYEREHEYSLAGSIYKGRVTRVLPGMQSAFVDIGLERDAFLYVSDFFEDSEEYDRVVSTAEEEAHRQPGAGNGAPAPAAEASRAAQPAEAAPRQAEGGEGRDEAPREGEPTMRRSRRRRDRRHRRSSGFPADKFVSANAPLTPSPYEAHRAEAEEKEPSGEAAAKPAGMAESAAEAAKPAPAPEKPTPAKAAAPAPAEPAPKPGAPAAESPFVLPGERLAKYTSPRRGPEAKTAPAPEMRMPVKPEPPAPKLQAPVKPALESEAEAAETGVVGVEHEKIQPESPWYAAAPPAKPKSTDADIYVQPFFEPGEFEQVGKYELQIEDSESEIEFSEFKAGSEADAAPAGAGAMDYTAAEYELTDISDPELENKGAGPRAADKPKPEAAAKPAAAPEAAEDTGGTEENLKANLRTPNQPPRLQTRGRRRRRGGRGRSRGGEKPGAPESEAAPAETGAEGEAAEAEAPAAPNGNGREPRAERGPRQIGELLKEGQEILVQIAKEPIGRKGARITSHLALPGRYLVYMPTVQHIGVSRKIASDEERARLKRLILENIGDLPGGFIVRTAAAGADEADFKADMRFLGSLWNDIRQQFEKSRAPALIYHDLGLVERTLRDQLSPEFTHIWVDSEEQYQRVLRFVSHFMPALTQRVRLYTRSEPMFEHFRIQEEIDRALKSKVWLKSGGYIVINQTEALVAIDVNTGKFVGKSNRLEDTIVKTNVDAIREIVRQIRLRDLGGIIVIDFIDMDERRNRQKVMQAMEEAMRGDRAPFKLLSFNDFGLMALTRKRVKQSLERALGTPCPYCTGSGLVKSVVTVCNEIYAEARKMAPQLERGEIVLRVNPEVAKAMKAKGAGYLNDIEEATGKTVLVRSDPQVHQEQFEIF